MSVGFVLYNPTRDDQGKPKKTTTRNYSHDHPLPLQTQTVLIGQKNKKTERSIWVFLSIPVVF